MNKFEDKLLWSPDEVAEACGINVKTVRKELEAGRIPGTRYGRHWKVPVWWVRAQRDGMVA